MQPFRYPKGLFNFSCVEKCVWKNKMKCGESFGLQTLSNIIGVTLTGSHCAYWGGFEALDQPQLLPDLLINNIYGPEEHS